VLKPVSDLSKQGISGGVPERIIYRFETVKIDKHDGEFLTVAPSDFHRVTNCLAEC
jgi:hypothetical protein